MHKGTPSVGGVPRLEDSVAGQFNLGKPQLRQVGELAVVVQGAI